MGLDMYLNKKTYVQKWDHTPEHSVYNITIERERGHGINIERVTFIEEELMYWRKANHIHKYFVDHCGGGEDNCQDIYISDDMIIELVNRLKKVIKAKDDKVSAELLPTGSGFFFGSIEYDEYYYQECERTLNELSDLLDNGDIEGSTFYQASW